MKKKKKLKKNNQAAAYCLSCKPEDFFYAGESTMGLNKSEIEKALAAAKLVCKWGYVAQAMLAICKIAEGYRQYEKQVSEIAKTPLMLRCFAMFTDWNPFSAWNPLPTEQMGRNRTHERNELFSDLP